MKISPTIAHKHNNESVTMDDYWKDYVELNFQIQINVGKVLHDVLLPAVIVEE
ncbi:CLUMA_CG009767, isoform A [Clunio marinus]|uniref:CLUMA_CG009767, isoform A n=1 Tax=Clunio marinus TaxID=568069 RepID=A0A1J1IBJ1_9DIPT|nr:CLUMA_CG009767, isoform A [Clunio marinus]